MHDLHDSSETSFTRALWKTLFVLLAVTLAGSGTRVARSHRVASRAIAYERA